MERRLDRRIKTEEQFKRIGVTNYEFVNAVDGQSLVPTQEIRDLFRGNDFGNRKGVIGCALSHYNLWKRLVEDPEHDFYLIFEDDITFADIKGFDDYKKDMVSHEVTFFGYHMFSSERQKKEEEDKSRKPGLYPLDFNRYIGGFFSYSINKCGAQRLLDYILVNGIKQQIDMLISTVHGDYHEIYPFMVFSEWNEGGRKIDTDIQASFNALY